MVTILHSLIITFSPKSTHSTGTPSSVQAVWQTAILDKFYLFKANKSTETKLKLEL